MVASVAGSKLPKAMKTGTTIVGVVFAVRWERVRGAPRAREVTVTHVSAALPRTQFCLGCQLCVSHEVLVCLRAMN